MSAAVTEFEDISELLSHLFVRSTGGRIVYVNSKNDKTYDSAPSTPVEDPLWEKCKSFRFRWREIVSVRELITNSFTIKSLSIFLVATRIHRLHHSFSVPRGFLKRHREIHQTVIKGSNVYKPILLQDIAASSIVSFLRWSQTDILATNCKHVFPYLIQTSLLRR